MNETPFPELTPAPATPPPTVAYPPPPRSTLVCGHCKRVVRIHLFCCDGHWVPTYHCPGCGDVVPINSAVVNYGQEWPDWSAA